MGEQIRELSFTSTFSFHWTLHFSVECSARGLIVTEPHIPTLFCGCLAAWVSCFEELGCWVEEVQASFAVASMLKQVGSTCGDRFGGILRARPF